jgi:hypothetical protein
MNTSLYPAAIKIDYGSVERRPISIVYQFNMISPQVIQHHTSICHSSLSASSVLQFERTHARLTINFPEDEPEEIEYTLHLATLCAQRAIY